MRYAALKFGKVERVFMLTLFAILWIISPVALIPVALRALNRKNKLENFIEELRRSGRISNEEYLRRFDHARAPYTPPNAPPVQPYYGNMQGRAVGQARQEQNVQAQRLQPSLFIGPPVPPDVAEERFAERQRKAAEAAKAQAQVKPAPETTPAQTAAEQVQPSPESAPVQPAAEQVQPAPESAPVQPAAEQVQPIPPVQPTYQQPPFPQMRQQIPPVQPVPKPGRERSPAPIMLLIGSALVVLSGMIFSIAKWISMTEWQRTGVIALAAAFFFGVSAIAGKKLKLQNTGMAFYLLGSVFSAITFVTMGYFGLLGESLSVGGRCFWLLYSLAALLVTLFSAGAVKLYHKGAFVHAALYGGLCSFTLMSVQLFDGSPDLWAMFLNIIAAIPIFLLYKQKLTFGREYGDPLKIFTIVLAVIYGVSAVPFMAAHIAGEWTVPCFVTLAVWVGQLIAYGILLDNKALKRIHPVLLLFGFIELSASLDLNGDAEKVLVFGCMTAAAAAAYKFVKQIRTTLSDVLFPLALFVSLLGTGGSEQWRVTFAINSALLATLAALHALSKDRSKTVRVFMMLFPMAVSVMMYGIASAADTSLGFTDTESFTLFAGLIFLSAVVFTFTRPVRTIVSDAVFPAILFICTCASYSVILGTKNDSLPLIVSALFTANVALHAFEDPEKRMVKHFAYILPFALPFLAFGAEHFADSRLVLTPCECFFAFSAVIFSAGLIMRFVPRIRTVVSDRANIVFMSIASFGCFITADNAPDHVMGTLIAAMILTLAALQCFDRKAGEKAVKAFTYIMPVCVLNFAVSCGCAVGHAAAESYADRLSVSVLTFSSIAFLSAFAFRFVKRLHTGCSDILLPFAVCIAAICQSGQLWTGVTFALMAVIMLVNIGGKDTIKLTADAQRIFLFMPVLGICYCVSEGVGKLAECNSDEKNLFCGLMIAAFGFLFRYSGHFLKKSLTIRSLASDIMLTVFLLFTALEGCLDKPAFGLILLTVSSGLILAHITERKPKHRNFVLVSRWLLPCVLMVFALCAGESISYIDCNSAALARTDSAVTIVIFAVIAVCFMRIRKLRTVFSDFAIPVTFGVFCGGLAVDSGIFPEGDFATAAFAVLCGVLMLYGFEKDGDKHLIVHRLAAPVMLLAAAYPLSCQINIESIAAETEKLSYIIVTLLLMSGAAVFSYLGKNPEHKFHKEIIHSQYAWGAVSGTGLFFTVQDIGSSTAAHILSWTALVSCAVLYIICGQHKKNFAGLLPVIAIYPAAAETARQIAGITTLTDRDCYLIMSFAAFIMLCGLSRLVNRTSVCESGGGVICVDFAAFALLMAPIIAIMNGGDTFSERWGCFTAVLELGIFFLNLIRSGHSRDTNRVMLTLAAASGCTLVYVRPFLLTENIMISAKIDLLPLLLFSVLVKMIWKDKKKLSESISFVVQLTAFGILLIDALLHQSLMNTIIVLCVTLSIMLVSFAVRSGRWFAISAASFAGLTIYITRGFVGRIEWWAYLLTAGLILIIVSAANEYLKSRGTSLKDSGTKFMKRWKNAENEADK